MRGATHDSRKEMRDMRFQSTLLMRGATPDTEPRGYRNHDFNPRSSCEERRHRVWRDHIKLRFQSTLLMRGATRAAMSSVRRTVYFNPRSSCEERPQAARDIARVDRYFNPRSSCEERRQHDAPRCHPFPISIHAPHARSDSAITKDAVMAGRFQSTLLMRGATQA